MMPHSSTILRAIAESPRLLAVATIAGVCSLGLLPFDHAAASKNLALSVTGVCALLLWISRRDKRLPLAGVFVAWAMLAALTLLWSHDVEESLASIWRDILKTAMVFAAFHVIGRRGAPLRTMVWGGIVAAIAFAGTAVYDFAVHGLDENVYTPARYDVMVDALNWIAFLGLLLPAIRLEARPWPQVAGCGAALTVLLAAGYMTHSRSFSLSIVAAVVVLLALRARRRGLDRRSVATGVAMLAAGLALGLSVGKPLGGKPVSAYEDREVLYTRTLEKILGNPWKGTGYGHETDAAWYRSVFAHDPTQSQLSWATHPHNIVLSYMDQMGVWGLLLLIYMFSAIIRPLLRAAGSPRPRVRIVGEAGLILVLFTVLSNSFNFFFVRQHLWMFFAMLGLFYGWIEREEARDC